jgi:hypothetical protein
MVITQRGVGLWLGRKKMVANDHDCLTVCNYGKMNTSCSTLFVPPVTGWSRGVCVLEVRAAASASVLALPVPRRLRLPLQLLEAGYVRASLASMDWSPSSFGFAYACALFDLMCCVAVPICGFFWPTQVRAVHPSRLSGELPPSSRCSGPPVPRRPRPYPLAPQIHRTPPADQSDYTDVKNAVEPWRAGSAEDHTRHQRMSVWPACQYLCLCKAFASVP